MRVIVAGRLSKKADERDQTGLDSQEREAVRWAEAEGHEVIAVVADFKSGRSGLEARPNLRPWVTVPEQLARYDAIVALKVDRLTRGDRAETAKLEQWAREHHKALLIASAGVRFPSEGTEGILWDAMLRMAHQEWLLISERYLRMQRTLRERGSVIGREAWGFEIAKRDGRKVFVPTEQCRRCAPVIFEMVVRGSSLREVASWMDQQGIRTRNGKPWHEGHIAQHILRNPIYKGQRRGEGPTSPVIEQVVPAGVWRAAGEALAARSHSGPPSRTRKALLSPLCGNPDCDATGQDLGPSPMYQLWLGRGNKYPYYRCTGRGPQRHGCGAVLIPTSELEEAVAMAFLADHSFHYETRYVAGDGHEDEIEKLRSAASLAATRVQSNALWDRIEALEAETRTPGGWITEETAITRAQHFEDLQQDEERLRSFLQKQTIYAWKEPSGLLVVSIL